MSNITFIENEHLYLNSKGIIIPSVSELIKFQFPNAYKGIPKKILNEKAEYGSRVHALIKMLEDYEISMEDIYISRIDPNIKSAIKQYFKIKNFTVKESEQMVCWEDRYAGTFDVMDINEYIYDIKTTNELHTDWLSLQIGLYYMAKGIKKDIGYCIWLPKCHVGQLVEVKVWNWKECEELVERYELQIKESESDRYFE